MRSSIYLRTPTSAGSSMERARKGDAMTKTPLDPELQRKLDEFEQRMEVREQKEAEQREREAQKLRENYLRRTGRSEMKP